MTGELGLSDDVSSSELSSSSGGGGAGGLPILSLSTDGFLRRSAGGGGSGLEIVIGDGGVVSFSSTTDTEA